MGSEFYPLRTRNARPRPPIARKLAQEDTLDANSRSCINFAVAEGTLKTLV